ncbi:hypothetical protein [Roseomonas populi]|uniref:Uncharacterized protein n=1 Tax=Roseomonas populi TaxID=3121582 RepID=A0ABT1X1D8_9PROT|nr:hypothetical protein [Roseomonas pecuniae]MCR0981198.1 hypothetical protein [Roseomonas pecuniae]
MSTGQRPPIDSRSWTGPKPAVQLLYLSAARAVFLAAGVGRGRTLSPGNAYAEKQAEGQPITPAGCHIPAASFGDLLYGLVWRADQ